MKKWTQKIERLQKRKTSAISEIRRRPPVESAQSSTPRARFPGHRTLPRPETPGGGSRHFRRHAAHAAHPAVASRWRWGSKAVVEVSRSRRTLCFSGGAQARWGCGRLCLWTSAHFPAPTVLPRPRGGTWPLSLLLDCGPCVSTSFSIWELHPQAPSSRSLGTLIA